MSKRRTGFPSVLQHDTALWPSDCGGPVLDVDGHAVGVNIARAGRVESYAIPAAAIKPLLADLKSGKLAPPKDSSAKQATLAAEKTKTEKSDTKKSGTEKSDVKKKTTSDE